MPIPTFPSSLTTREGNEFEFSARNVLVALVAPVPRVCNLAKGAVSTPTTKGEFTNLNESDFASNAGPNDDIIRNVVAFS